MERTPFLPDSELPTPIEQSIEDPGRQAQEAMPREARITEGLFVAEALSRRPQILYEKVAKLENTEEPFEKLHERRVEVRDEPTTSPVVSIGSIVATMPPPPQTEPAIASPPAVTALLPDDNVMTPHSSGVSLSLSSVLRSSFYRRAILMGFGSAFALLMLISLIAVLT